MPNLLSATGLTVKTRAELVSYFTAQYQAIYGADVNLASNTPDGQMMNIFIQAVLDQQDISVQIFNSFDPDNAVGNVLDQRVAINGIQRQAGTYTVVPITVVTSQSLNLYGLDQTAQPVYTIADNAGTQYQLAVTYLGVPIGATVMNFQAALPGATLAVANTIRVPVTIVLGVSSINNPGTYLTLGINEESDANLKVRRQQSVSLSSQGYLTGLLGALKGVSGVSSAFVYENKTGTTNSDGVPGHSIWVIVAGSAAASAIANAIYTKRNAGCGMYGATNYSVAQIDGTTFTVTWDNVASQTLFINFSLTAIDGVTPPNLPAIRAAIAASYVPGVGVPVNVNGLATLIQSVDANALVTLAGFSLGTTQVLTLSGVAASGTFVLNYNGAASAAINWNDAVGTIQTKVQAVTGLATATVTGSIASQTLTFNLTTLTSVLGLLYVTANSLATSAPAPVTFAYNEGYATTQVTSSKKNQLVVTSPNVIVSTMQFSPAAVTLAHSTGTQLFTGLGGYGTLTYSFSVNNSGGTINAATGAYAAGVTGSVVDTIKVTDSLGNAVTAAVTVT